ncbi:MAG: hypothetical protein L3J65_07780 [Robiginitomaculum sp.]|nr:hypothetical protein [Robiginitomaculum sp.]
MFFRHIIVFSLAVASLFLGSCATSGKSVVLKGTINNAFYEKFATAAKSTKHITINSTGGSTSYAARIGDIIYQDKLNITITGKCFSACAEYILPSAQKLTIGAEALIGFHWSPKMLQHLVSKEAPENLQHCKWPSVKRLDEQYKKYGANPEFWHYSLERIELESFELYYSPNTCPKHTKSFKNLLWMPTSEQLRTLLGLKLSETICADKPECYEPRIDEIWPSGTRIVVGDRVYISNAPTKTCAKRAEMCRIVDSNSQGHVSQCVSGPDCDLNGIPDAYEDKASEFEQTPAPK